MKPLTNEQYIQKQGLVCPLCGASDVEAGAAETISPDVTIVPCFCRKCREYWNDIYTLAGYERIPEE